MPDRGTPVPYGGQYVHGKPPDYSRHRKKQESLNKVHNIMPYNKSIEHGEDSNSYAVLKKRPVVNASVDKLLKDAEKRAKLGQYQKEQPKKTGQALLDEIFGPK